MIINKKRGFTIIEVVLVLAIAGMIFLMVFVALPALRRSQRNTQRKEDVDRVYTAVNNYISKHNRLPFKSDKNSFDKDFIPRYVDESCKFKNNSSGSTMQDYNYQDCEGQFRAPDGEIYKVAIIASDRPYSGWDNKDYHRIYFQSSAKCDMAENKTKITNNAINFLIAIKLEGNAVYCVDNS